MQAEGTGSKIQKQSEGLSSTSEQEHSAKAKAARLQPSAEAEVAKQQPPDAAHDIGRSSYAALGSLPAHSAPGHTSEVAANSGSAAIGPQPFLHLSDSAPYGQQDTHLPRRGVHAAQAPASAAQADGPWQEVRASRRKSTHQQATSKSGIRRASDGNVPDQETSAPAPLHLRDLQAAARQAEQIPTAQPAREAAEHLPPWLSALAGHKPWPFSQHEDPDTVLCPLSQAPSLSIQHEPLQATLIGVNPHDKQVATEQVLCLCPCL